MSLVITVPAHILGRQAGSSVWRNTSTGHRKRSHMVCFSHGMFLIFHTLFKPHEWSYSGLHVMINFMWLENHTYLTLICTKSSRPSSFHLRNGAHTFSSSDCDSLQQDNVNIMKLQCSKQADSEHTTYRAICVIYGFLRYDSGQQLTVQTAWATVQYSVQNWKAPTQRTQKLHEWCCQSRAWSEKLSPQ